MNKFTSLALSVLLMARVATLQAAESDVLVYGSTPGGFCAAIAAAREGTSVILLEPTAHVGGMNTGGLSFSDSNQMYREMLMGLFHEWHLRIQEDYKSRGITLPYDVKVKDTANWTYEPKIAAKITAQMLAEAGVQVLTGHYLQSVNKSGNRITSVVANNTTFTARTFVDGSYEGDLMAAAGVKWTIGREGTSDFNESRAGKRYPKATMNINGFDAGGKPLPLITTINAGAAMAGDDNIMAYSYRLCLTNNAANKVPMPAPANYDSNRFEVMRRHVKNGGSADFDRYPIPGSKVDGNNSIGGQFSLAFVGGGKGWAEANQAGRAAIFEAHKQYTLEFIYFLANDPVFSASQRANIAQWGLCADEFPDTDHFPPQLYVRESRRMQGMYVLTENDIIANPVKSDAIMVSSFPMDSHDCQRVALPGGGVIDEGTIMPVKPAGSKRGYPYHVPYRAILPKSAECDNLLVPVALSCTHVGMASLRIEATWMLLGQSAGIAAAMAAKKNVAVQDLSYPDLRTRLLAQGQALDLPPAFQPQTGITLDDSVAVLAGTWSNSTTFTPYIGVGYQYAGTKDNANDGSAVATFRFTAPTAGTYQIYMAYTADPTRATNVPVKVTSGSQVSNFTVDQTVELPVGSKVRLLGKVQLVTGAESIITISTAGTTGFVILDAIQLVPETGTTRITLQPGGDGRNAVQAFGSGRRVVLERLGRVLRFGSSDLPTGVRILDQQGRQAFSTSPKAGQISLPAAVQGLFIVDLVYRDGSLAREKFVAF